MDQLYLRFLRGTAGLGLLLLRLIFAAWFRETGIPVFEACPISAFFSLVRTGTALFLIPGLAAIVSASMGVIFFILLLL